MSDSFPPRRDDDEPDQPHYDDSGSDSDIPASIAFMEMMRQASSRASRSAAVDHEAHISPEQSADAGQAAPFDDVWDSNTPPASEMGFDASRVDDVQPASPADVRRVRRKRVREKRRVTFLGGMFR
ncbi:MAG: hypothetical protein KC519_17540, partial [Anaerolineae bacterium]|nr:hypothetical protein [Anaerolineae bacterium]